MVRRVTREVPRTEALGVGGPGLGAAAVEGLTDDPAGGTGSARVFTSSNVAGEDVSRGKMLYL